MKTIELSLHKHGTGLPRKTIADNDRNMTALKKNPKSTMASPTTSTVQG